MPEFVRKPEFAHLSELEEIRIRIARGEVTLRKVQTELLAAQASTKFTVVDRKTKRDRAKAAQEERNQPPSK